MAKHALRIDPNICPACRSVQVHEVSVLSSTKRVCMCRSCQMVYTQHFAPGTIDMNKMSPELSTDMNGKTLWTAHPVRYDANGFKIE